MQWTHKLKERTVSGIFDLMKDAEVCDYIRSGEGLPGKHTDADRQLQAEVCKNNIDVKNFCF